MLRDLVAPSGDDDASSDWRLPTQLDGLRVVCPLGRGGMGRVFLAGSARSPVRISWAEAKVRAR